MPLGNLPANDHRAFHAPGGVADLSATYGLTPANSARAVGQNEQRINVTYFRSAGTDTQMIAAAETFRAAASARGELYFPAGKGSDTDGAYLLDPAHADAVVLASGAVGLVGDGRGRSVIRMKASAGDYNSFFRFSGDGSYFTVSGLSFDGNSANNAVTANLPTSQERIVLLVNSGAKISVQDNEFINCNGTWTVFVAATAPTTDLTVTRNVFVNIGANSTGIDTSTVYFVGQRCHVSHNTFTGGGLGAKTAMEIHGDDQLVHHNIVSAYYAIGNLCGDRASGIGQHWHHNIGHRMGTGITLWSNTNVGNATVWGLEHTNVHDNYIEIDYDLWASIGSHRVGIGINADSNLGFRDVRICNNTIKYLPFTGPATATDGQSAGIIFFRNSSYTGNDEQITVEGNTIVAPIAAGIYFWLRNTLTLRLQVNDNIITNPGSGDPDGTIFSTAVHRSGMEIIGAYKDCSINRDVIVDDRTTHAITQGVYLGGITAATNCEMVDLNMRVGDGAQVAEFTGVSTAACQFYVRYRSNNYAAPTTKSLVGSSILDTAGVTRMQTTAPSGTTWTAITAGGSAGNWRATDNGMLGTTGDPLLAAGTAAIPATGQGIGAKIKLDAPGPIGNVIFNVSVAAVGLTSGFICVFDSAGALIGQTADLSSALTTGSKTIALVTPTVSKNAGDIVEVLIFCNGTTGPTVRGFGASQVASYPTLAIARFFTYSTGMTSPPSTITTATVTTIQPYFGVN